MQQFIQDIREEYKKAHRTYKKALDDYQKSGKTRNSTKHRVLTEAYWYCQGLGAALKIYEKNKKHYSLTK